jgi:hypothetical protein
MSNMILTALHNLDKLNDEHWTADGMPRLDVVRTLSGNPELSRKMLTDVAPDFTRASANEAEAEKPIVEAVTTSEPEGENEKAEPEVAGWEDPAEPAQSEFDWLMSKSRKELFKDEATADRAQRAINAAITKWNRDVNVLRGKISQLSDLSGKLDRAVQQANRGKIEKSPIQEYLKGQQAVRADKAARRKKFLEQGLDAGELAKELSGKSGIDAALNQRKPKPGSTRPDPRMPVRGTRQAG